MCAYERNPISYGKISRASKPVPVSGNGSNMFADLLEEFNMPDDLAEALVEHLGYPGDNVGHGSFAIVYDNPAIPGTVVKITTDDEDGQVMSQLRSLQVGPAPVPGVPFIYDLFEVSYELCGGPVSGSVGKLFVITVEKVKPLHDFLGRTGRPKPTKGYEGALATAVENLSRLLGEENYNFYLSKARTYSFEQGPADKVREIAQQGMSEVIETLLIKSRSASLPLRGLCVSAGNALAAMLSLDIALCDLHAGNWGIRMSPTGPEVVIIDFGVSVPASDADETRSVLEFE